MTEIPTNTSVLAVDFDKLGNIIIVGYIKINSREYLTITKTNADGIIDQNFGINGRITFLEYPLEDKYMTESSLGLKITSKNKILITENFYISLNEARRVLMQFNDDGSFDCSFGENGIIIINSIGAIGTMWVNLESNDFILLGGVEFSSSHTFISKFNFSGELDKTFGVDGKLYLTGFDSIMIRPLNLKLSKYNSFIIAGSSYNNKPYDNLLAFCKINFNGEFMTDFANNGFWNTPCGHSLAFFYSIDEDNKGNLMLLGCCKYGDATYDTRYYVYNFFPNGTIASYFRIDHFFENNRKKIQIVQNGSKCLASNGTEIIRFYDNGNFDINFNIKEFLSSSYSFSKMQLQTQNKLLLIGISSIIRLNIPSDVSVNQYNKDVLFFYPNPVKNKLYINNYSNIEIRDIQGRVLIKSEQSVQSVDVSLLQSGIYYIIFDGNQVRKFIKE